MSIFQRYNLFSLFEVRITLTITASNEWKIETSNEATQGVRLSPVQVQ